MQTNELISYLDGLLKPWLVKDYAPNGLQVEGKSDIRTIVTAVTADQYAVDRAVELGADCLLVHHGYFWKSEPAVITGMKQRRLKALLSNDINLIGYHLPLDIHPKLGNNAQLGQMLGINNIRPLEAGNDTCLVLRGELEPSLSGDALTKLLEQQLGRSPLHIAAHSRPIKTVAWCTGGAQDYLDQVAAMGIDAFISGEVSERTYHSAVEQGTDYFSAGHHATERGGIKALGEHLASQFDVSVTFVDTPNPV
ncbi:Nif3-like dinuclear metal center hexameric protein [Ferrimonas lipolytica]|uniref:GTP cyclohydrolase 1 type 2 homolog n=1 Tax=Ferrimonas lipolytica TaxID=2724191 RepID=A0A6H1UBV9_9GAMM|nr:Nif3-like dinuclear metal center hexameric protein [Ferrimonas lipolytica]QIZ76524.1 Nif3-like dinuclear metal center hexameric protein [Ferrimonas lipolytica]